MIIPPSQAEVDIRAELLQTRLGDTDPLTYYQGLLEDLRTGRRADPNKDEFRDVYDYAVLMAGYGGLLLQRIAKCEEYMNYLTEELRKVNPAAVGPKLNKDSVITIDGTQVTLAELAELMANAPD